MTGTHESNQALPQAATPRISVIVPAYNARHFLEITLPAILESAGDNAEVIVIDDGSTDDTASYLATLPVNAVRLPESQGPSGARNAGAATATGEYLVFLDADVLPKPDTISRLTSTLKDNADIAAVFGSYDDDPADQHTVSAFKNLMHHYVHQNGQREAQTFWTGCSAIRKKVFDEVGPFRPVSIICVEDIDYGHRLRDAGHRVWLLPAIQGKHLKRWTLLGLIRADVMTRGIPWTVMMRRRGKRDNDLNLGWRERISALCAAGSAVGLMAGIALAAAGNGPAALIVGMVGMILQVTLWILQRRFYRFLGTKRGVGFLPGAVVLHNLYFLYSLVAFGLGQIVYFRSN